MTTATGKAALKKVQRRAAHWICSKWNKHNYYYKIIRPSPNWAPMVNTIAKACHTIWCCQTYKILNSLDCINFEKYFRLTTTNTRHHHLTLFCEQSRINCYRHLYFINAPYFYSLPRRHCKLKTKLHDFLIMYISMCLFVCVLRGVHFIGFLKTLCHFNWSW